MYCVNISMEDKSIGAASVPRSPIPPLSMTIAESWSSWQKFFLHGASFSPVCHLNDKNKYYQIPAELAATVLLWVLLQGSGWMDPTILQQRKKKQLSTRAVVRFIQKMRTLLQWSIPHWGHTTKLVAMWQLAAFEMDLLSFVKSKDGGQKTNLPKQGEKLSTYFTNLLNTFNAKNWRETCVFPLLKWTIEPQRKSIWSCPVLSHWIGGSKTGAVLATLPLWLLLVGPFKGARPTPPSG